MGYENEFKGQVEKAQPVKAASDNWSFGSAGTIALAVGGAILLGAAAYFLGDSAAFKEIATSSSLDAILANARGAADWGNTLIERGSELLDPLQADVALAKATKLITAAGGEASDALQTAYNQGVFCVNDLVKPGAAADTIKAAVQTCASTPFKL